MRFYKEIRERFFTRQKAGNLKILSGVQRSELFHLSHALFLASGLSAISHEELDKLQETLARLTKEIKDE